jgi:hypothetical protein
MNTTTAPLNPPDYGYNANPSRTSNSAVSWGAIVAGAAAGAALSLILLILGVGLGLSAVSPWVNEGISAERFGMSTIIWLSITQLLSSALGGYLAGRLRTKWVDIHNDEVYFRDTAHGFLAWAVASLATAVLLTSVIGAILGGAIDAGAAASVNLTDTTEIAREASAYAALWIFVALLIGAFSASLAATLGGKQRDAISPIRST